MTKNWLGIASVTLGTLALVATPSVSESHEQIPPVGANLIFQAIDTSPLMLQPDRHQVFGVENAFPGLQFDRPVYLTSARDDTNRIFVVEQGGIIRVFPNDATTKKATTFLDLRAKVRRDHNEEGMLGLAFHPKFRENGAFFVFHSVTPRGCQQRSRSVSKARLGPGHCAIVGSRDWRIS